MPQHRRDTGTACPRATYGAYKGHTGQLYPLAQCRSAPFLLIRAVACRCGDQCLRTGRYLERRAAIPCEDVAPTDPNFLDFLEDWERVSIDWNADWRVGTELILVNLRLYGCDFLGSLDAMAQANVYKPYFLGLNPCVEHGGSFPSKPLSYFCPVACGCRSGDPHCPDTCPARNASTPTCPAHQRSDLGNFCPQWSFWVTGQPQQPDQVWHDGANGLLCPSLDGTCPLSP